MGGGGGGEDFAARAAADEAKKKTARDKLNVSFGVTPTGGAPSRGSFVTRGPGGNPDDDGNQEMVDYFDQAGYDAAMAEYTNQAPLAAKNKLDRDALYDGVRANAFGAGKRDFDEKRDNAKRDLKFALFAQGLNGGSVDVDQNSTVDRTYNEGLIDLGSRADAARTDLVGSDEQARLGLLQSIDAGMDQGSVLSSALQQLKINSDRAGAAAQGTAIGNLFDDAGLLYTKSNAARGKADAQQWWEMSGGGSRAPSSSSSGIITRT